MKVVYFTLWLAIAHLHRWVSSSLFKVNQFIFKYRGKSLEEQKRWVKDYNAGFLDFPNGFLDKFSFTVLLLLIFFFEFLIVVLFDLMQYQLFKNSGAFIIIFFLTTAWVIYAIYFRSSKWLKRKINGQRSKFELRLDK